MEIVLYIAGLVILYFVIQASITTGINNSIVGKFVEKEFEENVTVKEALLNIIEVNNESR